MKLACRDCGTVAEPVQVTKGSILIEIVLWLCLLVPGIVYSIWRHASRHDACPACRGTVLLPLDTPVGSQMANHQAPDRALTPRPSPKAVALGRSLGKMFAGKRRT